MSVPYQFFRISDLILINELDGKVLDRLTQFTHRYGWTALAFGLINGPRAKRWRGGTNSCQLAALATCAPNSPTVRAH